MSDTRTGHASSCGGVQTSDPALRGCVAVAVVEGTDLSAVVGADFGRSPRFLLLRGDSGKVEVVDNSRTEGTEGAGPATASLLVDKGVTAVIAGQFGPRAEDALRAGGILPVAVAPGTNLGEALAGLPAEMHRTVD